MEISRKEAFYIVGTFSFLLVTLSLGLIPSNLAFCRRVFDTWPEIEEQFPELSGCC